MSVFTDRPNGYKTGLILLLVGCLLFIVGFSSPNWTHCSLKYLTYGGYAGMSEYIGVFQVEIYGHNGLWISCSETTGRMQCASIGSTTPGWLTAVRGLQCLTLVGLFVSCCYAVAVNWVQSNPLRNRLVEIIAAVAALLGFSSAIEYAVKSTTGSGVNDLFSSQHIEVLGMTLGTDDRHLSWAFAIDMCGCVLSFLAAIIIATNNNNPQTQVDTIDPRHVTQGSARYPHTPITVVPRPMNPTTNMQLFYVPQTGLTGFTHNSPPSVDIRPPAYSIHNPLEVATPPQSTSLATTSDSQDTSPAIPDPPSVNSTAAAVSPSENDSTPPRPPLDEKEQGSPQS